MRGEACCGIVCGCRKSGKSPVEAGPRVDFVHLAGADDRMDDGGVLAGVGVAFEEPVAQSEFR